MSMDVLGLERRRNEILRQIRMYQNRLEAASRELCNARNEADRLCREVRSCDSQMSGCWGQINKLEGDISELRCLMTMAAG